MAWVEYPWAFSRSAIETSSSGRPTAMLGIQLLMPVCSGYLPLIKHARLGEQLG